MLVIRKEQMDALGAPARSAFEDEMLVHLGQFSPPLFNALGEGQLRRVIRFGLGRAREHGFNFRGPLRLYLESMLLFGSHFDTDPQYPWAAEILTHQDARPQMQRAHFLYAKILDYRKTVTGPDDAYTLLALRRIRELAGQELPFSAHDLAPALLREIGRVYPQKADYIGPAALEALIQSGIEVAMRHHFSAPRQVALIVVLMLAFGHGCTDDPLYPWIGQTLQDDRIRDLTARANRLNAKALIWLDHVLAYFDGARG